MKRGLIFVAAILLLLTGFLYYSNKFKSYHGARSIFMYSNEGIGYSDIEKMYAPDTGKQHLSFFQSKTIQKVEMKLRCGIRKTIITETDERQQVAFELFDPEINIESNDLTADMEAIKRELTIPFFAEISKNGKIMNVRIDTAISYFSSNTMKQIVSDLQFVQADKQSKTWGTSEENISGTYRAKYRFVRDSGNLREYLKTNTGYTKIKSGQDKQQISVDSRSKIFVDSTAQVQKINSVEAQFVLFDKDTIAASGSQTDIQFLSATTATVSELVTLDKLSRSSNYSEATSLSAGLSSDKIHQIAYTNTLANDNWDTLIQKLESTKEDDAKSREQLVLEFRALAYLVPETCEKMKELLLSETFGSIKFQILLEALSHTGTKQSINTLVRIISERKNHEDIVLEILPVLSTTTVPTNEAIEIARELAFEQQNNEAVRSTAQLTLAALAYNFRKSDVNLSEELTKYLIQKMEKETDTIQKILVLGNTGSPSITPLMKTYIFNKHVSTQVRTYAIASLKLINDAEVTGLLRSLSTNRDEQLRKAADATITFRNEYFEKP